MPADGMFDGIELRGTQEQMQTHQTNSSTAAQKSHQQVLFVKDILGDNHFFQNLSNKLKGVLFLRLDVGPKIIIFNIFIIKKLLFF